MGTLLGIILIILTHYSLNWFDFDYNILELINLSLINIRLINIALIIMIVYVYSLLADIDTKSGTIVWTFILLGLFSAILGYVMNNNIFIIIGLGLIAITFLAAEFFPHRGFTHSIIFGILVSLPWLYVSWHYSVLSFICFYSHLCGDQEFFKLI